jgi:hypothetical protein
MLVAGKAGTTVGIMAIGTATETLATKAMRPLPATRAVVAGATVSQDMPVSAGVVAAAGIAVDMAVGVAMAAAAIADDQEVRS